MIYENILEAAGNTPLIRLQHMTGKDDAQILVKFEAVNVVLPSRRGRHLE